MPGSSSASNTRSLPGYSRWRMASIIIGCSVGVGLGVWDGVTVGDGVPEGCAVCEGAALAARAAVLVGAGPSTAAALLVGPGLAVSAGGAGLAQAARQTNRPAKAASDTRRRTIMKERG